MKDAINMLYGLAESITWEIQDSIDEDVIRLRSERLRAILTAIKLLEGVK